MNKNEVLVFKDKATTAEAMAKRICQSIKASTTSEFHIALSGGSTPKLLFEILAKNYSNLIEWERVHLWWGDERYVPKDNEQSNFQAANHYLLSQINIPINNIHPVNTELPAQEACENYIHLIKSSVPFKNNLPNFDFIILGMGDDGHTASIFPHQLNLFHSKELCVLASHPTSEQVRISFTGTLINNAKEVCFLITGKEKASKLNDVLKQNDACKILPASYVRPTKGKLKFYINESAASFL